MRLCLGAWSSAWLSAVLMGLAIVMVFGPASQAWAATAYTYTDERGVVHITDNPANVPDQYREAAKMMNAAGGVDGYIPTGDEVNMHGGMDEKLWFRYNEMSKLEKKKLVIEAGMADFKGVAGAMRNKASVAIGVCVVLIVLTFIAVKNGAARGGIMTLLMVTVGMVLMLMFVRTVRERRDMVMEKVREAKQMNIERQQMMLKALEEE